MKIVRKLFLALIVAGVVGCAGQAFDKAKATNSIQAYDMFLNEHAESEYADEAAFRRAQLIDKIPAYRIYMLQNKSGKFHDEAKKAIERLEEEEAAEAGDQDYLEFDVK